VPISAGLCGRIHARIEQERTQIFFGWQVQVSCSSCLIRVLE
jgi:hypothetical protein